MLEGVGVAVVGEAGGERAQGAGETFGFAQEPGAAIGGDGTAVEARDHGARAEGLEG